MREIFFDIKGVILHSHISVMNFIRTSFVCILLSLFFTVKAQYISVSTKTPDELVRDVLIGSKNANCISVSNVSAKGWQDYGSNPTSYGYFEKGTLPFDIEKGIILSTGDISKAPGPNSIKATSNVLDDTDKNWDGDRDLADALGVPANEYLNSTVLEFDFTPNNTTGISFEYMFLSEEYFNTNCNYPDAFVFLIKKAGSTDPYTNIALVPGTTQPVTSQTINAAQKCISNVEFFGTFNNNPYRSHLDSPTAFNGETKVLTAQADVVSGETYHIKLVVADRLFDNDSTGRYDSAVFLKAGSFVGKKDLGPDRLIAQNNALCEDMSLILDAEIPNATYQWFRNGTALTGENAATYNVTSAGVYEVEINTNSCLLRGAVQIEYAAKPVAASKSYCNYNNGKPITVNLQSYNRDLISNYQPYFKVTYENASGEVLPDNFSYTNDLTIYAKVQSGNCETVTVPVELRTPIASTILQDQTICAGSTTRLQTENTFIYYKWMRENGEIISEGNTTYSINDVPAGKYTVELTSTNGCKLQQDVMVSTIAVPVITHIEVSGNTATVFVSGGQTPYEYSLDGVNFQSSNLFAGLQRGMHTVYIRDMMQCSIVSKEFLIINLSIFLPRTPTVKMTYWIILT